MPPFQRRGHNISEPAICNQHLGIETGNSDGDVICMWRKSFLRSFWLGTRNTSASMSLYVLSPFSYNDNYILMLLNLVMLVSYGKLVNIQQHQVRRFALSLSNSGVPSQVNLPRWSALNNARRGALSFSPPSWDCNLPIHRSATWSSLAGALFQYGSSVERDLPKSTLWLVPWPMIFVWASKIWQLCSIGHTYGGHVRFLQHLFSFFYSRIITIPDKISDKVVYNQ